MRAFLGAGEHEGDLGVAVGDEALHAVEVPFAGFLAIGGLELHGLQVGARVGLGEVHGVGVALGGPGQVAAFLVVAGELVYRLGAVLQSPDVGEAGVAAGDELLGHDVGDDGEVQPVVLAGQGHAVEARLHQHVVVALGAGGVFHPSVDHLRPFVVHALGVLGQDVPADFAHDVQDSVVIVHRVLEVTGGDVAFACVGVVAFFQRDDFFHQRMSQVELQVLVVCIEISHILLGLNHLLFFL